MPTVLEEDPLDVFCRSPEPGRHMVTVRVKPNAPKTRITGVNLDRKCLELALHAPAREGAANDELIRFLRITLGVPRAQLSLRTGTKARDKVVEVLATRKHLEKLLELLP